VNQTHCGVSARAMLWTPTGAAHRKERFVQDMKSRLRPKTGTSLPLLLAVPAASLALMTLPCTTVAQEQPPVPNAQTQQPPLTGNVISEIIVTGNKVLNAPSIIAQSGHKVGDPYNQQVAYEMQDNIFRTGYFGYRAGSIDEAVRITSMERDGKVTVEIQVDENPKVADIAVEGSGPIKPEVIRDMITKTPVYNVIQFVRDAEEIRKLYEREGYQAAVTQDSEPDANGILKVGILVTRVGEIKVSGNRKTSRRVILREMQTKEGDFYNVNRLREDLRNLYNLQIFEEVTPSVTDKGAGIIGLTINVPERRTGQVLAGIGFSNRAQLIGTAEIADTNFQGTGRALSLRWQTGGAVGRSSVEFNFTEPWLDKKRTRLNVALYDRIQFRFSQNLNNAVLNNNNLVGDDTRYNEQRTGATITVQRPYGRQFAFAATLRGENVRPDPLALTPGNAIILQNGPIGAVGFSVSRDTRDLFIDPVSGGFQNINLEFGYANLKAVRVAEGQVAPPAFGSSSFIKSFFEFRQFFPIAGRRDLNKPNEQKSTLGLRAYFGTSTGRLPFFEQFFVGGAESLRGYREDRFWGRNVLFGSMELRQPIARSLKGVLFVDVGTAWGGEFQSVQIEGFGQSGFSLNGSVGLGLRVGSPLGLLRLDYGLGSEGGRTHFSIGNVF
jgi:outer membrane protein insertion porin family